MCWIPAEHMSVQPTRVCAQTPESSYGREKERVTKKEKQTLDSIEKVA